MQLCAETRPRPGWLGLCSCALTFCNWELNCTCPLEDGRWQLSSTELQPWSLESRICSSTLGKGEAGVVVLFSQSHCLKDSLPFNLFKVSPKSLLTFKLNFSFFFFFFPPKGNLCYKHQLEKQLRVGVAGCIHSESAHLHLSGPPNTILIYLGLLHPTFWSATQS